MKARRNGPCPCGSGRKYKACCMERDDAVERSLDLVRGALAEGEPPWFGPAREAVHWEADLVPLGPAEDEPGAEMSLVMVVAAGFVVHGEVLGHTPEAPFTVAAEIAAAVKAAGRIVGVLPGRLLVRDPEVAGYAGRELRAAGTEVEASDELPELDPAAAAALEQIGRPEGDLPAYTPRVWRGSGVPAGEVAALFRAAAAFYRAEPWVVMGDTDLLLAHLDGCEDHRFVSVLGGGGETFGINLFVDLEDLEAMAGGDVKAALSRFGHPVLGVLFSRRDELSPAMQREVAAAGWEVAGPDAYPMVMVMNPGDPPLPAVEVRTAARVMEAVTALVESHRGGGTGGDFVHEPTGVVLSTAEFGGTGPWEPMLEAEPNCAVGPKADPEAALGDPEAIGEAEAKRVGRFERFLRHSGLAESTIVRHATNADAWAVFLRSFVGVPAGAATEYDLRTFLYDWYPRKANVDRQTARSLPVSLKRLFRWMAEREGIAYPWAEAVLANREALEVRQETAPGPFFWDEGVAEWRGELYTDLDRRVMMHDAGLPGTRDGWPASMTMDVARLERELERRWQIWRDEEVRGGLTDPEALYGALVRRQRAWERTPHPAFGGKTPQQVVAAAEKKARR